MTPTGPALPPTHRVLHSLWLPLGLLGLATATSLLALRVEDDATDTVLGAVTGAATVLLLFVLVVQLLGARQRRRARAERDQEGLDSLEPLRAARRDSEGPTG